MKVYQYPKCSTCRKALAWLRSNDVEFESIDIVISPPNVATLRRVLEHSGLPVKKLFNTSGEAYRQGGYKERLETMSEREALAELAANGKLVKRPLVVGEGVALAGFDAATYASKFGK